MSEHPPGPPGHPVLGCLNDFRRTPLQFLDTCAREYGDVVSFRMLHMRGFLFAHPDQVHEVLLDRERALIKGMALDGFRPLMGKSVFLAEGAAHKRQKRMMQPAFHHQRIEGYANTMVRHACRARETLQTDTPVEITAVLSNLTLAIAAETLFGVAIDDTESAMVSEALTAFAAWYHRTSHPLGPILQYLPTEVTRNFRSARRNLFGIIDRMVADRRSEGDRGDILSMLVFARDEDDGEGMGESLIRDEALTLLIAGHETTAAAMAWAIWLLGRHPEARAAMEAEVDTLEGRTPTFSDLPNLPLCRGVFGESLRLYPPSFAIPRQAARSLEIGGWAIPKGSLVMLAPWVTHRDPRFWDAPLEFSPSRWTPEAEAQRHRNAFLAFGGGPKICMGESFAWMEGPLLLATLAQRWRFEPLVQEVELDTTFTLRPAGGLTVRLEARR